MKQITLNSNDGGQRLDKYLQKSLPALPRSLIYKYIRLKRVKVNGKRAAPGDILAGGDILQLYINDELLVPPEPELAWKNAAPEIDAVYEDEHILLINKPSGLLCHEGDEPAQPGEHTLIDCVKAYLFQKGAWNPAEESSFVPALCNRIDRNTSGIVIAAKTAEALRLLNEKIRSREIDKSYLCLVHGVPRPKSGILEGYILKDSARRQVSVLPRPAKGALYAKTGYKRLGTRGGISLVECTLFTGRTHQIRAQMAHIGHPLAGDTKYGTAAQNKSLPFKHQALHSYKIAFNFKSQAGALEYLRGRVFECQNAELTSFYEKLPKN